MSRPIDAQYGDEDMADVGRAFMEAIEQARSSDPWVKTWAPIQCPSEIIFDLLNRYDEKSHTDTVAQGSREPAGWLYEINMDGINWEQRFAREKPLATSYKRNITPLYASQPPAAPVETKCARCGSTGDTFVLCAGCQSLVQYSSAENGEVPFTNPNHAKTCALYWDKLLQGINSACGCGGLAKDRQLKDGSGSDQPASAAEWRDNYNACWDRARSDVKYDALKSAALKALNYIENTENELGIKLSCGDALREVLK